MVSMKVPAGEYVIRQGDQASSGHTSRTATHTWKIRQLLCAANADRTHTLLDYNYAHCILLGDSLDPRRVLHRSALSSPAPCYLASGRPCEPRLYRRFWTTKGDDG